MFALEFSKALPALVVERAVFECHAHRAARFALMGTIAEATPRGQRGDVGKRVIETFRTDFPKLKLAPP